MDSRCTRCKAPMSHEEVYWFYTRCMRCEQDAALRLERGGLLIKLPHSLLRETLFRLRRIRHSFPPEQG